MDYFRLEDYPGYVAFENGLIFAISLDGEQFYPVKYYRGKKGYIMCTLNGKLCSVHRVIAKAFIKDFDKDLQVNHKNGIKGDNRVINLEICTNSDNMKHAIENGLVNNRRSKNGMAKLTEAQVLRIKELLKEGVLFQKTIADAFGVHQSTISDIKRQKYWRDL